MDIRNFLDYHVIRTMKAMQDQFDKSTSTVERTEMAKVIDGLANTIRLIDYDRRDIEVRGKSNDIFE